MKFEEIQKLWTSDCNIDETELAQESVKIPQLHNKYLILYSNEKLKFKEIKFLFSDLFGLLECNMNDGTITISPSAIGIA